MQATSFEVGIVFSAYALAQTISVPIAGKLSDRFGRRTMILWSLAGSCGGFLFQVRLPCVCRHWHTLVGLSHCCRAGVEQLSGHVSVRTIRGRHRWSFGTDRNGFRV